MDWWTTTGGPSWWPRSSWSIDKAASILRTVAAEVALSWRSLGSWHDGGLESVLLLSGGCFLCWGNASIVSAKAWCFFSTLLSTSWTDPKASRTDKDKVCSWSEGSPFEKCDLDPGGVSYFLESQISFFWQKLYWNYTWKFCSRVENWNLDLSLENILSKTSHHYSEMLGIKLYKNKKVDNYHGVVEMHHHLLSLFVILGSQFPPPPILPHVNIIKL